MIGTVGRHHHNHLKVNLQQTTRRLTSHLQNGDKIQMANDSGSDTDEDGWQTISRKLKKYIKKLSETQVKVGANCQFRTKQEFRESERERELPPRLLLLSGPIVGECLQLLTYSGDGRHRTTQLQQPRWCQWQIFSHQVAQSPRERESERIICLFNRRSHTRGWCGGTRVQIRKLNKPRSLSSYKNLSATWGVSMLHANNTWDHRPCKTATVGDSPLHAGDRWLFRPVSEIGRASFLQTFDLWTMKTSYNSCSSRMVTWEKRKGSSFILNPRESSCKLLKTL